MEINQGPTVQQFFVFISFFFCLLFLYSLDRVPGGLLQLEEAGVEVAAVVEGRLQAILYAYMYK